MRVTQQNTVGFAGSANGGRASVFNAETPDGLCSHGIRRLAAMWLCTSKAYAILSCDEFGLEIAASNSVAAYAYALDRSGIATNEAAVIGGVSRTLLRGVDGQGREARHVR